MLRFRVGGVAGERNEEAHVEAALGVIERAGEAVKNAAEASGFPVLFDLREAMVPGVAAVNYDGELCGVGELHLRAEDGGLRIARGVIVEIIEADFAPGNDFAMLREAGEFVEVMLGDFFGLMRMDADAGEDPFVL